MGLPFQIFGKFEYSINNDTTDRCCLMLVESTGARARIQRRSISSPDKWRRRLDSPVCCCGNFRVGATKLPAFADYDSLRIRYCSTLFRTRHQVDTFNRLQTASARQYRPNATADQNGRRPAVPPAILNRGNPPYVILTRA